MNDEDIKLLELYLQETRKKRIIIFGIIAFFLLFSLIIGGKYYIKYKSTNGDLNNNTVIQEDNQNLLNEIVENTVVENTNSENVIENKIENNENTVVEKPQEESKQEEKKQNDKPSQPSQTTTSQTKKEETSKDKPQNKDFLFTDGYTMDNVTQAAQDYLKSSGRSGECVPLKDSEGVYYGMRVIFH